MMGSKIVLRKRTKVRHLPERVATGAYIMNEGIGKLDADEETVKQLHNFASETYPFVADMEPRTFVKALGIGEIILGGSLLAPFVPSWLAGAGLAGFSGGLLNIYLRTPGMHRRDSVRPTPEGRALAKDVWMFGIALSLLLDSGSWFRRRH